ncbi:MAG: nucleotidyltransferase family protein [Nitrososphaerota archaeon]|jgi:NDP-sugar pyrophosphorylase family protein|nr:nucleotidyltransferase family protein [Nitrososphaerota archaeon]MDG6959646.1 nucleotidyltransferase family protein [Nitrososphaerota archaeon]MDG6968923.1 nucleotidyltransferase family protein [Nitrososphaerota archaeon]MDG6973260.1 nucleotidyltransferase family protein [Nitrososphaerota archaeon]MDG6976785.1 nucleotidyltransferase family protein [Nitrososphaerota archaeon]
MRAIILSGGLGMRLRPLTDDKPKALVPVNGRPISEYQIDWLVREGGVDAVTFACGYKWERLKEHFGTSFAGVSVDYSVEEEPLGTGGGIKKAIAKHPSEETFVVANGDIVTDLPLKRMVEDFSGAGGVSASMLVVPYRSRFGVVKIDKLKMIRGFDEKPAFPDVWINGGVYLLNGPKITKNLPDNGDIERETFPKLVTYGELLSYPYYGEWSFIDSIKDLVELESALKADA